MGPQDCKPCFKLFRWALHGRKAAAPRVPSVQGRVEEAVGLGETRPCDPFYKCANQVEDLWAQGIRAARGIGAFGMLGNVCVIYMLEAAILQDMDAAWSELLSAEATRSKAINAQIREYAFQQL